MLESTTNFKSLSHLETSSGVSEHLVPQSPTIQPHQFVGGVIKHHLQPQFSSQESLFRVIFWSWEKSFASNKNDAIEKAVDAEEDVEVGWPAENSPKDSPPKTRALALAKEPPPPTHMKICQRAEHMWDAKVF